MDKEELDAITERIIGAAHKVSNTLGAGFVDKVYENAHAHEMRKNGLIAIQQHPIKVVYDGIVVGEFLQIYWLTIWCWLNRRQYQL